MTEAATTNEIASTGSSGQAQKKPFRTVAVAIREASFRNTSTGNAFLSIVGKDEQNRPVRAILWGDAGRELSRYFDDKQPNEENPIQAKLTGYWKPRTWTNNRGEQVKSFEFVVKEHDLPLPAPEVSAPANPEPANPASGAKRSYDLEDDLPF